MSNVDLSDYAGLFIFGIFAINVVIAVLGYKMNGKESGTRRESNGKIPALFSLYILFGSHNLAYANYFLSKDADILFFCPYSLPGLRWFEVPAPH